MNQREKKFPSAKRSSFLQQCQLLKNNCITKAFVKNIAEGLKVLNGLNSKY
jgi:hypothetical protein